jgi:N-acyl-D-amino-acid deacylase
MWAGEIGGDRLRTDGPYANSQHRAERSESVFDILLTNGTLVDGTKARARRADVGIIGDRIAELGDLSGREAIQTIDCDGLIVAPGMIDIHTHYDAQVLWDPALTPSSSFGVTSVVLGNCGLSIAPLPPSEREGWMKMIAGVEGMSPDALQQGIDWTFSSFDDYLSTLESLPLALNVGAYVGHQSLRMSAMGADSRRAATGDEVREMRRLLRESFDAGAIGFSTSKAAGHIGTDGKHVPSWFAALEEMYELAEEVGEIGRGVIQQQKGIGYEVAEFTEVARRSGANVTWTALHGGMIRSRELYDESVRAQERGLRVLPQIGVMPTVAQFNMDRPYLLKIVPAFAELEGNQQARLDAYRDSRWRARALEEMMANREGRGFNFRWTHISVVESPNRPDTVGRTLMSLMKDNGDDSPLDTLLDLALADDLRTRIEVIEYDEPIEDAFFLGSEATLIGSSDAGAHVDQMCNAAYGPHLLGEWVREKNELTLEFAIWRLTGQPAAFLGLPDRGHITVGSFADVFVFDKDKVASGPMERKRDLPGGGDRLIRHPIGVCHVLVNGTLIRQDEKDLSERPGQVLRHRA